MSRLYDYDIDESKNPSEEGTFNKRKIWLFIIISILVIGFLSYDAVFTPSDFDVQYVEYKVEDTHKDTEKTREYNPLGYAPWNTVKGYEFYNEDIDMDNIKELRDSIVYVKSSLIKEVNRYIQKNFPGSPLSPKHIVNLCEKKKFDITLLMSQTHIETAFGLKTNGTNSCFGVVSKSFSNPNNSVDQYIELMQSYYVKNRTTEELFASNFKRVDGNYHYAEDPEYTVKIKNTRDKIIANTNISELFSQLISLNNEYLIAVNNFKRIE